MDPSQAIGSFLTPGFWVLCVVIGVLVSAFRWTIIAIANKIDTILPDKYYKFENWWKWLWREAVLPAAPVIFGALIGYFISDYPYPEQFAGSKMSRLFIGIVAGIASGFLYPRVMFYLGKIKEAKENKPNE